MGTGRSSCKPSAYKLESHSSSSIDKGTPDLPQGASPRILLSPKDTLDLH